MKVTSLWLRSIWSDGRHNAFPGIARFGDHYYVTCRNADGHQSPRSSILVIRAPAADLDRWEKVASFDLGADSRDPFIADVNGRLHVYWHHGEDYVATSADGLSWTTPQPLDTEFPALPPGCDLDFTSRRRWLFRFRRGPDGAWYSIGRCGIASNGEPGVLLYRSLDGIRWAAMHTFGEGIRRVIPSKRGGGHESDIAFMPNGVAVAAIRTQHQGLIASAPSPWRDWDPANARWTGIYNFGGPALHVTPHGLLLAARSIPADEPARCTLWTVTPSGLINPVIVPSGGDCAYQTFADGPAGEILLCYYSSHEWPQRPHGANPANLYLARVTIHPGLTPGF